MTRRTLIVLSCDLCDPPDEGAHVTTLGFSYAGRCYELDVCPAHSAQVQNTLAGWAASGRPARAATGRRSRRQPSAPNRRRTASRVSTTAESTSTESTSTEQIRRWARQHGHQVPDRGPLPAAVVAAFHAAQPDGAMSAKGLATGAGAEV